MRSTTLTMLRIQTYQVLLRSRARLREVEEIIADRSAKPGGGSRNAAKAGDCRLVGSARVLSHWSNPVPTIVVEVMPKAELLDPQGKAVTGALSRMGRQAYSEVRIGKRFELTVAEVTDEVLADVKVLADDVFSNSVIEDVVSITVADAPVSA